MSHAETFQRDSEIVYDLARDMDLENNSSKYCQSQANSTRQAGKKPGPYASHFIVKDKDFYENGQPKPKRAECRWCGGEWAYNQTRLRKHIVEFRGGCPQIPLAERIKVRELDKVMRTRPQQSRPSLDEEIASPLIDSRGSGHSSAIFEDFPFLNSTAAAKDVTGAPSSDDLLVGDDSLSQICNSQSREVMKIEYTAGCVAHTDFCSIILALMSSGDFPEANILLNRRYGSLTFEVSIGSRNLWSFQEERRLPTWSELKTRIATNPPMNSDSELCEYLSGNLDQDLSQAMQEERGDQLHKADI